VSQLLNFSADPSFCLSLSKLEVGLADAHQVYDCAFVIAVQSLLPATDDIAAGVICHMHAWLQIAASV